MLKIRLQRTGRENVPTYRIVVAEKSKPVKGKFQEVLGHYLPSRKPPVLEMKTERFVQWIEKGAIPSETIARLLHRSGVKGMEKHMHRYTKRRSKKEADAAPAAAPAAPAPEKSDTAPAQA